MKKIKLFAPLTLILLSFSITKTQAPADSFCGIRNVAFKVDEEVSFTVYYAVAGIYVNAGTATFTSKL